MKPIKFEKLSVSRKNVAWVILFIVSGIFPALSLFDVFSFLAPETVKWITAGCYLTFAVYNIRPFFYRNHVQWNKRGITIRVNSFLGTNFGFSDVRDIVYAEDAYTIYMRGKSPKTVSLEGVEQRSKERLLQILQEHVR